MNIPGLKFEPDVHENVFAFMKKIFGFLVTAFLSISAQAQDVKIIKLGDLQNLMSSKQQPVQVINFWATWCAPCVKELPLFQKLEEEKSPQIKITLVNLDFAEKASKVNTFVTRKKMTSEVILLDEVDYNTWIDLVDKSWGGAIPATLVINTQTGKRKFIERELKEGELQQMISEVQ
jgi:thiol-disulfide isomerase/thioredoxin